MKSPQSDHIRVLGIAPSARGFGYAVMEGESTLVDWGVKAVKGDKNSRSLSNVANLIALYHPTAIALEDVESPGSRRRSRVQVLIKEIMDMSGGQGIEVKCFSRKQITHALLPKEPGTKHALAQYLASRFPEELGFRLPPKRRLWMSEDYRMDIFDAVALAEHFSRSSKS